MFLGTSCLRVCYLSAISFAIHHVTYTIYNTRSLSADAECCPPHYPVHDFSSSTKQSYPFNISLYILCHLQKQQTFPRTDYNFKEYREHPYAHSFDDRLKEYDFLYNETLPVSWYGYEFYNNRSLTLHFQYP